MQNANGLLLYLHNFFTIFSTFTKNLFFFELWQQAYTSIFTSMSRVI